MSGGAADADRTAITAGPGPRPGPRPGLRLLADDLTGALDAAAAFTGIRGVLRVGWRADQCAAVDAVSIDSRDRPEGEAVARSRAMADWLVGGAPAFRKIDSQLRGHVAAELAAQLDAAPADRVIVAPAFPAQHRITRGGVQWRRAAAGAPWQPAAAPIADLLAERGLAARAAAPEDIAAAVAAGGTIVADAETDADLAAVARAGLAAGGRTLWVGSAGLAAALAAEAGNGPGNGPGSGPGGGPGSGPGGERSGALGSRLPGPLLMLLGTARPPTLRQVAAVEATHPDARLRLAEDRPVPAALAERLAAGRPALVTVDLPPVDLPPGDLPPGDLSPDGGEAAAARRIRRVLAAALDALAGAGVRPGTLFVSGGQTLAAVAEMAGTDHFAVDGEVEPGVPCGRWVGGRFDGVRLVAKSGGFGGDDLLCRLIELSRRLSDYERT